MSSSDRFFMLFAEMANIHLKLQIQFLIIENQILRQQCVFKRIVLSESDRNRLLKFGLPLGPRIRDVISIVSYGTFRQWVRNQDKPKKIKAKRGRPRVITDEIRLLIANMAKSNKWGLTKILAEVKKLGIKRISRTSVQNILKEYGIDPFKIRTKDTWDQFLKRTFDTLWACDFFSKSVWTPFGRRMFYVLFFINIKTRKIHIAGVTKQVTQEWLMEQMHKMEHVFDHKTEKAALVRDRDIQFREEFDKYFEKKNITVMKIPKRSPNLNPYAESWVATIKRECLNHFLVLGKVHLEHLVDEFVKYYNNHRPHSRMNNEPLVKHKIKITGEIRDKPILGGLMHHYYRE